MARNKINFLKLAKISAKIASDKKGSKISILNVRRLTTLADYFVIVTVDSMPQMKAITDAIYKTFNEKENYLPVHSEGRKSSLWSILDYGGLVVHVMLSQARNFYALDKIWAEARKVKLRD
ncbi:MAG: ribosome silencing factor [Endomicrobiales bacterium]|nr:ribosome silencing factor [Endomicrobiales bacterium]